VNSQGQPGSDPINPYETARLLDEYLLFHYGSPEEVLPWRDGPQAALDFPVRCVAQCVNAALLPADARALDVGCAVGRSTFELARHCAEAVGIDYSRRFIEAATVLAREGSLPYRRTEEGAITTPLVASVPADVPRDRAHFEHGDAHALRESLGAFDVVFAANLIDRLGQPERFLARLPRLVKPGGQLVLASPYTWLPEFTSPGRWLGGFIEEGRARTTQAGLESALAGDFALTATKDIPFLIREHARKYQWSVAQATIWRRN
jgi:putative 4-mercaptohistidine N1-methyltranferase